MKKQALITIFFLLIIAGRAAGQCTVDLSPAGANIQSVCINTDIVTIVYSTTGITDASVTGLPDGVTGTWVSPNFTISGKPTVAWSAPYTVTFVGDGGCSATGTITVLEPPVASAGGSTTICESGSATVSGASAANGSILWSESGSGTLSNETTTSPTYTPGIGDAGTTVTLTMTVSNASCSNAVATYTVNVAATPSASAGGSTTICETGSATVSGASAANGTILWTESGSGTLSDATTLTPTYTPGPGDAGTIVTLTMTVSNAPCSSATATYSVNVVAAPTASAGGSTTICEAGSATVSGASATNGTILWTKSGSGILTDATTLTPTYTPGPGDAGTTVTLTMTVSNASCSNAVATYTVNVAATPSASAGGSTTICETGSATVSGASAANGTILWTESGSGTLSGATTLTPTYTPGPGDAGTVVTLTMTVSNAPCSNATATYTVNIVAAPTASAGGSTTICETGSATVSGASAANGTVLWTKSGSGILTDATTLTPTYTPGPGDAGSTVTLIMTVSNASCSDASATYTINIVAVPTASAGGSATICPAGSATVSGASGTNGTISWTHNGSGTISGSNTLTPTYNSVAADAASTVILTLTVSNAYCSNATATYSVFVNPSPTLTTSVQTVPSCNGSSGIIRLSGLLPGSVFTVGYTIDGDTETPITGIVADASGNAEFNTRVLTTSDNGDVLRITSITVTSLTPACVKSFSVPLTLQVHQLPTLTRVQQVASVCSGNAATFQVSGLIAGTTSTLYYTVDGGPEQSVTGVVSGADGKATFTSIPLTIDKNGKRLYVTAIRNTGWASGCYNTITDEYAAMEVKGVFPVISGPTSACANVSGKIYTTDVASATSYAWSVTGGTINSGQGTSSVNVTWTSSGSISVTCVKDGCTGTSSPYSVSVNPVPAASIAGDNSVCVNSTGNLYTTTGGMSSYQWEVSGGTPATGDGSAISVTWTSTVSTSVRVRYTTAEGCMTSWATFPVTVNALPVPGITPSSSTPRIGATVTYTTESGAGFSGWQWQISGGGTGSSSSGSINVTWNSTGSQYVKVNYMDDHGCTAVAPATHNLNVNTLPSVSGVHIDYPDGDPKIGGTMEVDYTYTDGSSGTALCTYEWFSNGVLIPAATSKTYVAQASDFNKVLTCEVTPVSSAGPPYQGTPVLSTPSLPVENLDYPAVVPVADLVCIEGLRTSGSILKGKYRYTYPYKDEGISTYRWIRRDSISSVETVIGTNIEYTLTPADLEANKEIYFEVTPVSSNFHPVTGMPRKSKPFARIFGLDDRYGVSAPAVTLSSNVPGGYFSGPGMTGSQFSPAGAGIGTWEINHFRFYEYSTHTCSQRSPQNVVVDPNTAFFSSTESKYCYNDPVFTVDVNNVPGDAVNHMFSLTDPNGIASSSLFSIVIDPSKMTAGVHTLVYSYRRPIMLGLRIFYVYYKIDRSFTVDRVSTDIKFVGLDPSYCENDDQTYVTVEGVYPLGGTGIWTGTVLGTTDVVSAYLDPELGDAGNTYVITYQYKSLLNCYSNILSQSIKINPLPITGFSIDPTYNVEGPSDRLIPVQPGGIFKGKGISGDMLIPSIAGAGTHTITYTIRDGNSCVDSLKKSTVVRAARGTITGITDIVCYEKINLNITASGLPVNGVDGVVSYGGFRNTRNTLSTVPGTTSVGYSVQAAGEGNDTISFSYLWDGVDYSIRRVINIDSLGTAIIYNLEQNQMICDDVAPFELTVSKPGGVFSGPVVGGYFDPSKATTADTVKYTFTNSKTGCSIDTSIYVKVYKAPVVDFIPYDICIDNDQDPLRFMNKTVSSDPVVKWNWEFYDEGKMTVDSIKEAEYLYLRGGLQKVALSAETDKGCVVKKEKTFDIARRPEADFYWKKDCYHPGESLQLFDATTYTTQPKSFSWRSNGVEFSTSNNAVYPKADTGIIKIEYIVRTNYYMCHDTVKKNIYIRPVISVPSDGYFEDFEGGKAGWIISDTSTIWSFGTPSGSKIKAASSGSNAWFTGNARDGSSSIESPCFDLSYMHRPVVKLKLAKELDKDRDGVALQYRIGDESDWHYVGTIQDGIEWYNSATISGKPGGNSLGWTTAGATDTRYKVAVHTLDELIGKKDVKFRMAYGSSGAFSSHDGVSFDDIYIGERSRQVLVEHFTSYSSSDAMSNKALVDTIASRKEGDVINIQYHTNLAGTDSLYFVNPGEINARILFYGLGRVPYTFIDGGSGNDSTFNKLYDYRSTRIDSNDITKRTLMNSAFRMHLEPVISGRVLTVKGYIKAVENIRINNLTLFIAVTEKKSPGDFAGVPQNLVFLNVFRKFIPDAAGTVLKSSWTAGDSVALAEKTWMIEKVLNSSDIEIIAFLQSSETKEVYQAFSVIKPEILVGIENPALKEGGFSVYPNPASSRFTVEFNGPLNNDAFIRIYSIQGEIIREYRAGKGTKEFVVEDPGLKDGIYLVRVSNGIFEIGYKKLIINDN